MFLIFLVIVYLFFLVGKTVYENYKFNKQLSALQDEINASEIKINKMKEDIEYFKTDEYREREAREKLNKQKPGETVIVITPDGKEAPKANIKKEEDPNYVKWWEYLSGRLEK
ncbi:hypothetical protein A2Y26_04525 [candidate division CPR2 bacterium GWD2_39_7]|nr:MAG: hypothetical protein A2Y27_01660 [candidate division CPR2 bacterium GWD1_39_7]OGB70576.1 MAG: hypothetical protein A2Y26_04525 [candidate division CPR2 bacterium GWD2_39_7]